MNDLVDITIQILEGGFDNDKVNNSIYKFIDIDHSMDAVTNFWNLMNDFEWFDTRRILFGRVVKYIRNKERKVNVMFRREFVILQCIAGMVNKKEFINSYY